MSSSSQPLKQQIQNTIDPLPPNLLPLMLNLIHLLRSHYPTSDTWDLLQQMAGTVEAPPDWSLNPDHYLYGTPKQD
ncbi:hypothetical protein PROH_05280 [Prochlorothrix hollandica PCC 9006 = CALU 1027]|uniref:Uncharacterized protein n=1 Tax=Prochlorothrix hollandica PCC 9006 = CALU 1027 TaxID=317619 RepID=A0A0M2Q056_PROHO|nr:hypothetical protein PROH_05280 [Prochlorothrix hollandica PCC 9006 = CALU 1027]